MESPSAPNGQVPNSQLPVIPERGLLLHVGVFKTGTTALQEALRAVRPALEEAGVLYRGPHSWQWKTLLGLMSANKPGGPWRQLKQAVQSHPGRVMVSSENLCGSTPAEAAAVVEKLGANRPVTIMITVRSVSGLLASSWQQLLKRGLNQPFDEWLHEVFDNPRSPEVMFWRRNDFTAQVRKWGGLVGEENVVIALSDKNFPSRNLEIVEDMLLLPRGTVLLRPDIRSNRSMTFPEAELLRRLNGDLEGKLTRDAYRKLVRLGAFPAMYKSDSGADDPIPLPKWACDAAMEIGMAQARELQDSRAVIVGDLTALGSGKWDIDGPVPNPTTINMSTAVAAINGALLASQRDLNRQQREAEQAAAAPATPQGRSLRSLLKRS